MIQQSNVMGSFLSGQATRQKQELGMRLRDAAEQMNAMESIATQTSPTQSPQYNAMAEYGGPTRSAAAALSDPAEGRSFGGLYISPGTRAKYRPSADALNISMDFNAAPKGSARGTEVIIPDDASPQVRQAAERYNQMVAEFAARHGIADYPIRGVRTRSENGRGVPHTIHTEPFFNSDTDLQRVIQANPAEFAAIYREAFGVLPSARLIAPHGVGGDRGAASDIFGDETSYGELMANALLGQGSSQPNAMATFLGGR